MLSSLDATKVYRKNCPTTPKGSFKDSKNMLPFVSKQLSIQIYGSGMLHLDFLGN
jgi:hypothetical protein